ncbi:AbrB/MazE/SpoVT family DNA-binding domain-containing protein [Haliea sp.]
MKTETSKLTSKYQATIPETVRKAIGLQAGDRIAFDIDDGVIRLRKAVPLDLEYSRALEGTLSEWNTAEDEEAYRDL